MCDHGSTVRGRFGGKYRNLCCKVSGGPRRGVDIQQEEGAPGRGYLPMGRGGKGETGPMLGEVRVISQRKGWGAWPSSLRPAIAGGPSPNEGGAEGPHRGPPNCIFNIVCIYGVQLPCGRVLCLWVPRGTLGPPQSGAGTWREGFPALSKGRARDLTLHSWKLGQGPGPQRPTPTPGSVPLPGRPCQGLMKRAGHWGAQKPRGSRYCCPPCGLASHAPEMGRVAGTPMANISPTQAAQYCVWPLSPQGSKFK